MGQGRSCIQGAPDWLGPYEKSTGKATIVEKDLYERLSELILFSTITKDYGVLEEFLINANKTLGNTPPVSVKDKSSTLNSNISISSSPIKTKTLEDIFRKETLCKSVNFVQTAKDSKSPIVKPVIASKRCAIHGDEHKSGNNKCAVHGVQRHHIRTHSSQAPKISSNNQHCKLHSNTPKPQYSVQRSPNGNSQTTDPSSPKSNLMTKNLANVSEIRTSNKPESTTPIFSGNPASAVFQEKTNAVLPPHELPDKNWDDDETLSESSCPAVLQNLISNDDGQTDPSDLLAALPVKSAKETINRLEDRAETIVETFAVVLKHLEHGDWSTFCISASRLCDDIRKILRDNNITSEATDPEEIKIRNHVVTALNQLTGNILQLNMASKEEQTNGLLPSFRLLGEILHELMEFLISKELMVIVENMENKSSCYCVKSAICAIAEMATTGILMSKLITQAGAIQMLLNIFKENRYPILKPAVLRTLSTLCNTSNAASQLETIATLNFLIQLLESEKEEENVKCEVVSLLTQLAKQWSENGDSFPINQDTLDHLVKVLKDMAQKTRSSEAFLLIATSLSALSAFSTEAFQWTETHGLEMKLLSLKSKQESYV